MGDYSEEECLEILLEEHSGSPEADNREGHRRVHCNSLLGDVVGVGTHILQDVCIPHQFLETTNPLRLHEA
jgi:hypothetical protein